MGFRPVRALQQQPLRDEPPDRGLLERFQRHRYSRLAQRSGQWSSRNAAASSFRITVALGVSAALSLSKNTNHPRSACTSTFRHSAGAGATGESAAAARQQTNSESVKQSGSPGFPNKAAAATPGGWIYVFANGSSSVLRCEVPSLVCGCTLGESELEAAQPSRVWRLRSGQVAALPPDEAVGGRCRDTARGCVVDHPAGPHASARMV